MEEKQMQNEEILNSKISKKKRTHMFETYISKVLKQISSQNGITHNAKQQLNSALCHILKFISENTIKLTSIAKKKTISLKEVENALKLSLSGKLLVNSLNVGNKSLENLASNGTNVNVNSSRQLKAGIIFPPSIVEKFLRGFGTSKIMVSGNSPIFLASVLEYICYEILDLSVGLCSEGKHIRITIRDLELSVRNDTELNDLFCKNNISFLGGGVVPFIHSSLLNKTKTKKKKTTKKEQTTAAHHRFRYGTLAIKNIKKQQKISNSLVLSKSPFEKLVRNIFKTNQSHNQKISKEVFTILQYFIEQYIVNILKNSNFLAIHSGRVKVIPSDILLYMSFMRNGKNNPYTSLNLNLVSIDNLNEDDLSFPNNENQNSDDIDELDDELDEDDDDNDEDDDDDE
jgi:histone H2A